MLVGCAFGSFIVGEFANGPLTELSFIGGATVSGLVDYSGEGAGNTNPEGGEFSERLVSAGASAEQIAMQMGTTLEALENSNITPEIPVSTEAMIGSLIWQTVTVNVVEVLRFRWNFVERDWFPYDGWAFYGLAFQEGRAEVAYSYGQSQGRIDSVRAQSFAAYPAVGARPATSVRLRPEIPGWTPSKYSYTANPSLGPVSAMPGITVSRRPAFWTPVGTQSLRPNASPRMEFSVRLSDSFIPAWSTSTFGRGYRFDS